MPKNIEIKAKLNDIDNAHSIAESLSDQPMVKIAQRDTFFKTTTGRLKLRDFLDDTGELIFYEREDTPDPTGSYYQVTPTSDTAGLRKVLSEALGVRGEVVKSRSLYICGRTRIHVDEVKNLGSYLELEVVLQDGESQSDGTSEANEIMEKLSIGSDQLIHCAYIDLLTEGI